MSFTSEVERNRPKKVNKNIKNRSPIESELFKRSHYFVESKVDFRRGSQNRSGIKLVFWSWISAVIDSLVVISISCFCVVFFAILMKTPLKDFINYSGISNSFKEMFICSFLLSFWVYLVTMRVFMGASLGEWTCQLRLGQPLQRILPGYVLQVALRTSLQMVTGFLLFPFCSLIFKRDFLGDITGIRVYSLV
jgi:hypothetical protein